MSFNITPIVVALIGLLSTIITAVVIPYFKSKTTNAQRENIYFWVKLAVEAAEQIYNEGGQGTIKKKYVEKFLSDHGIALDADQLDAAIEAAVLEMKSELES